MCVVGIIINENLSSVSFATPRKWLISAKIGYFEGNAYYGGTIQYRLTR
jgi:hypothetical protein